MFLVFSKYHEQGTHNGEQDRAALRELLPTVKRPVAWLLTTGYGRPITGRSPDASPGGSGSAKTTTYPTPTQLSRDSDSMIATARRRRVFLLFTDFFAHNIAEHMHDEEGNICIYFIDMDGAPQGRPEGVQHHV